jgi:hypothetical protein
VQSQIENTLITNGEPSEECLEMLRDVRVRQSA